MSILRARVRPAEQRAYGDRLAEVLAQADRGGRSMAGPTVTPDRALRLSAYWSAVNLLADLVATLPVDVYRGSGVARREVSPQPPVIVAPSAMVSPVAWRRQVMMSWLLRGNVWGLETVTGPDGWPAQVEVLHPDRVTGRQPAPFAPPSWYYQGRPIGPIHHEPAYVTAGSPLGLSPVEYARESMGLGLAAQEHGARWYGDGAHPSAALTTDQIVDEDQAKLVKQRFVGAVAGREPVVLGLGMKYEPIQVSPADSQFLEAMRLNRSEIVALVFPHLVLSEGASMTYANVEARALDLLVFDLQPWLVRFESWMSAMLPRGQYVKLNVDAIVRTTLKDRYEAHAIALRNGFRSVNEVRDLEDESGIGPDGDLYLWPPAPQPSRQEDPSAST